MPGCQRTQVHALQRVRGCVWAGVALAALLAAPAAAQGPVDAVRQLYNQGRYDAAVKAAAEARADPASVDAASLILGRACLERFRQSEDRADLVAAREALREVRPGRLSRRDQADYLVGLGESLYLEESYGAAAQVFAIALARSAEIGSRASERVFDWWATSLDRQAQTSEAAEREMLYIEILVRAESTAGREPGSAAAAYWIVVARRGLGELAKAWDAAVAAWVRAPLAEDQGVALRADLDRFVLQGLIPDRVRLAGAADRDRERTATALRASWEAVKKDWSPR